MSRCRCRHVSPLWSSTPRRFVLGGSWVCTHPSSSWSGRPGVRRTGAGTTARTSGQRGAALLVALLLVALVTTLTAVAHWQQWRAWQVEARERDRAQAAWLLVGALDWARLVVREDGRASATDHLNEPWAVPLQPTRLATFLERAEDDDVSAQAWLSGRIEDAQGRLNWRNLVTMVGDTPRVSPLHLSLFERLFQQQGLPLDELDRVADALRRAWLPSSANDRGTDRRPVRPQHMRDLRALGLSPRTLAVLEPLTVWLPQPTPLNVNTAVPAVLQALLAQADGGAVQRVLQRRNQQPFAAVEDFLALIPAGTVPEATGLSVTTQHFLVTGQLRLETLVMEQRALLRREGARVHVLWREQSPLPAIATLASVAAGSAR